MKSPLFQTIVLTVALLVPAKARIGETVAESDARYGKPTEIKSPSRYYSKNGYKIVVKFRGGKAAQITFGKEKMDSDGVREGMTKEEIQSILKSNGDGAEWEKANVGGPLCLSWVTKGMARVGIYQPLDRFLLIITKEENDKGNEE